MSASERLAGVRAKIERAKHHIHDLETRVESFREPNPDLVKCEYDKQANERVFKLQQQLPVEFSLIAGESIHQLRSALDLLACQLVGTNSGKPTPQTAFPVCKTAAAYKSKSGGVEKKVEGMSCKAIRCIEAVQPYQAGYESLWALHKLDIADKHHRLLVVAYGVEEFGFSYVVEVLPAFQDSSTSARVEKVRSRTIRPRGNQAKDSLPVVFHCGDELVRFPGGPLSEVDKNVYLAFKVALANPEIGGSHPIPEFLTQLSQFVDDLVSQFAPLLELNHEGAPL